MLHMLSYLAIRCISEQARVRGAGKGYGVWDILPPETTGHFLFFELFDGIYLDRALLWFYLVCVRCSDMTYHSLATENH